MDNDREQRIREYKILLAQQSKIPKKFKDKDFSNWNDPTPAKKKVKKIALDFATNFLRILSKGTGGMIFFGTTGTGKTHLAIAIIKFVITRYRATCKYVNIFTVISEIRDTWGHYDKHEKDVIDRYSSYHLLVIDELGVQFGSKAEKISLFQIVNQRYEQNLPTIFLTNLDKTGLIEIVGETTVDRIFENGGGTVPFDWKSERK